MNPLVVHLGELAAGPRDIEFSFSDEEVEEHLGDLAHPRSFHRVKGTLTLEKIAGAIDVSGKLEGFFTVSCSRCLKAAKLKLPDRFQFVFIKEPEHFDPETELSSDDLETAYYNGDTLDLEPHIWDQIILSVPMVCLCNEDCKGITYHKGKKLEERLDPRWEALRKLQINND